MKRAISLVMALVLSLGLCACAGRNKYVGTYKNSGIVFETFHEGEFGELRAEYELTLSHDGSGMFVVKSLDDNSGIRSAVVGDEGIKKGDILQEYTLTWEETENYITISGSGKMYTVLASGYLYAMNHYGTEKDLEEGRYRLEGDTLVWISGGKLGQFQKVS